MKIIDSHHHLWKYSAAEYPWMGDSAGALKHDFLVPQLTSIANHSCISGFVTVQARQSLLETLWLLEIAASSHLIQGVVGWLPLQETETLGEHIEALSECSLLKGVRHVVQDEANDDFILGTEFNRGVAAIAATGWVYDILIYARHLGNTIAFVDQHPNQQFVLDHIAKPTIVASRFDESWASGIRELAKRPNVACKFSGVATEIRDQSWDVATIQAYWDVILESFGAKRVMYGSDWPVCLMRTEYHDWKKCVEQLSSSLSDAEQQAFWSENAIHCYNLTVRKHTP